MHAAEKALAKACNKIAKWYPEQCRFQKLPNGFLLQLNGDSEFSPAIGVVDENIVGALDSYDVFLDLLGYECQVERCLFDADRMRFILDAGWSGKYWKRPTEADLKSDNFKVDTIGSRMPAKITAEAVILISVVHKESIARPLRAIRGVFKKRKS